MLAWKQSMNWCSKFMAYSKTKYPPWKHEAHHNLGDKPWAAEESTSKKGFAVHTKLLWERALAWNFSAMSYCYMLEPHSGSRRQPGYHTAGFCLADGSESLQPQHGVWEPSWAAFLPTANPRIQTLPFLNGTKSQNPEKVCKSIAMGRERRGSPVGMFSFDNFECAKAEKEKFHLENVEICSFKNLFFPKNSLCYK